MSDLSLSKKAMGVIAEIYKILKPKSTMNVLDFSKEYGILSHENSSITGKFIPFPYQEDILRDCSDDDIEMLVWMKSTRVGYTRLITYSMAFNISEDPCPQLVFQPNDKKAGEFSKKELKPMLRDMVEVGSKIFKNREDNNLNFKAYPGGFIEVRGGNAANNYASATAKKVYLDEYDRFPDDVDKEGDPADLAQKRTESYWDGTVYLGSTPTIKNHSKIETRFNETDMRFRYLPCPHCGKYQILDFKNLVWSKEFREGVETHLTHTAKMKCVACEELISHKHKRTMDEAGKWRQTKPFFCCGEWQSPKDNETWNNNGEALCKKCSLTADYNRLGRKKRGYHIWAGYSFQPNTTWAKIAEVFVQAIGNVEKMKTFKNTWLGETWEEEAVKLDSSHLRDNIESYSKIPDDAKIVILTADTQNDRLEYLIKAWCPGETSYNIKAGKIMGDPINKFVWDQLLKIINTPLETESGKRVNIFKGFVDMGGGRTDEVKAFVRKNSNKFLMLKGDDKENKKNDTRPVAALKLSVEHKDKIMWVATTKGKDIVFDRLSLAPGDYGFIHHNESFDEEWFEQLTAEKKIFKKNKKGFIEQTYIKTRDRNEALDLEVYSLAAVRLIQVQIPNFDLSIKEESNDSEA